MNKRIEKILRLAKEGHDIRNIAKRCGHKGGAMTAGMEKVREVLRNNGVKI